MLRSALFLALIPLALVVPAEAATRATGILMNFAHDDGRVQPALFSIPGHDMPMSECRQVIRGQVKIFRQQLKSDRDFAGLSYVNSKCVYLDTDPLGLEDQD